MIVKKNRELKALYHELSGGDIFIGNLSLKYLKHAMLIDMRARGIPLTYRSYRGSGGAIVIGGARMRV